MPAYRLFRDAQAFNAIQGANLPELKSTVEAIVAEVEAAKTAAEWKEYTAAVPAGYSMNIGARPDWKMSMRD